MTIPPIRSFRNGSQASRYMGGRMMSKVMRISWAKAMTYEIGALPEHSRELSPRGSQGICYIHWCLNRIDMIWHNL
jgi:hypothetical protein